MIKILYVMEGEIEDRFILQMQRMKKLSLGKRIKFNLMQREIKQSDNIMTAQYDKVVCILDTDESGPHELAKLQHNIKMLKQIAKSGILIMAQRYNFEDELKRMSGNNRLNEILNLKKSGLKDVKKFLAQDVDYSALRNVDFLKYISRTNDFYEELKTCGISFSKNVKFITSMEQCK